MRLYMDSFGEGYDLDNSNTYKFLPQTINVLRAKLLEEIGYYYVYVNYWHNDIDFESQCIKVEALIKTFSDGDDGHRFEPTKENIMWYQELLYLFLDEIENMC